MKNINALIVFYFVITLFVNAQSNRILLDEDFSDWDSYAPIYSDNIGDQLSGEIDFHNIWAANDNDYFFLRFETGGEINLQNDNSIILYIDTDNNSLTGLNINGIGAELEYNFGNKSGKVYLSNSTESIGHFDIGLVSSPTVASAQFELVISRLSKFNEVPLFQSETIKLVLKDNGEGQDILPNEDGGIEFSFKNFTPSPLPSFSLAKLKDEHIRFLSYNVLRDNLFDPTLKGNYSRILQAINPEIISFQEIYGHSSQETAAIIEELLPSGNEQSWYHSKVEDKLPTNQYGTDLIVVSRFPIKNAFHIEGYDINGDPGDRANFAVLIDLRPKYNSDLLLLNAHPPCCSNDEERQEEIDKMMAFIRDAKAEGGELTLDKNTPIVITGDMNFVGLPGQRETLLTGNIFDNANFGEDFFPDWDSTDFVDLKPYTTYLPMSFTWYEEWNIFSPGRLDYIIYSASVLKEENSFVLFTPSFELDTLNSYNLQERDVVLASDHLPVVADFSLKNLTDTKINNNLIPNEIKLFQNYPNPFNPTTTIQYSIPRRSVIARSEATWQSNSEITSSSQQDGIPSNDEVNVKLKVYDVLGREVATLVNKNQKPGKHKVEFNATDLSSGIYYYKLTYNNFTEARKMILLK